MRYVFCSVFLLLTITGCSSNFCLFCDTADSPGTSVADDSTLVIDVRSAEEYAEKHIEGAINIPETEIAEEIENYTTDKSTPILLYCRSGRRAGIALEILTEMGYTNVQNIGGYEQAEELLK